MGSKMVVHVGPLECTPKGEDQRYSLKRHVLDLESKIGENNITISNVDEECKQELEEQKTTIEQITTQDEKQQNLLDEQKNKIDKLSSNSEQHQGELQRLSLANVAEVKKLAEQKSLLEEHKSELDRYKSENELQHEAIETSVQVINNTIYHIQNEHTGKLDKLYVKDNQLDEKLQTLIAVVNCPINEPNTFKIDGGCYMFVNQTKSFNNAKTFCESKGGSLFEPRTVRTNKLVADKGYEVLDNSMWLGIISTTGKSGPWKFASSGENVSQTIWHNSQPNDSGSEICAYVGKSNSYEGKWWDYPCTNKYQFICEFV